MAHQLGFARVYDPSVQKKRPAIVLPWFDLEAQAQTLTAVKYRFIDEEPGGLRYISRRGSMPILFGMWAAVPGADTLLLVEGEINALSVWQCLPRGTHLPVLWQRERSPAALAGRGRRRSVPDAYSSGRTSPARSLAIRTALGRDTTALRAR